MSSGEPTVPDSESGDDRDLAVPTGPTIGRFVVGGILGHGGMGVVMRARDPELDRDVAIKVLHPGQRHDLRLDREAQAMAKLSHPNVVAVYDVGEHDGSTYIAMELVEGRTLRAWRKAAPRTWREILAIYLAAGRGLAAAHAADLVHRDFKPDNVLVGADDRPRVTDFGLVASEADAGSGASGAVVGTPAYMAPEQRRGDAVDARTDQFAFCVALKEALDGERVPRWLTAALARGLAKDPAARWPRLDQLLDHLARPRRAKWIAAGVAAVAVAGAGVAFVAWPHHATSCDAHERRLIHVWDDARRAQVRARFRGGTDALIEPLDRYAETWVATRVGTCEDERSTRRPAAVRAITAHCFDDALAQLDAVAGAIAGGELTMSARRAAVTALPNLASCSDLPVLTAITPRPTDAALARRLTAVEDTLAAAEAAYALGRFAKARDLADGVRAEAEAIDYAPTLAGVLRVLGTARSELGDNVPAEADLRASLRAADAGRDDRRRLDAYVGLISVLAELGRWDEADALIADARSTLVRIASPKMYESRLLAYEADVRAGLGDDAKAIDLYRQAMALHAEVYGTSTKNYGELEYGLGGELLATGDVDGAEPLLEDSRRILVDNLGPDVPMIAKIDSARSFVRYKRGDLDGAIAILEESLATRERVEGADSPTLSNMVYTLGGYYRVAGRLDDAIAIQLRGLGLLEQAHGKEHPRIAMALNELVQSLLAAHRDEEAAPYAARGFDLTERVELPPHTAAIARFLYARTLWPAQKQRSLALARRAADELRALGDEKAARAAEEWIGAN